MFEKLSDRLNMLMAEKRINANELARKTGVPASTIKKIRNKDNPNPTLTTLMPLANFFSVTLSQLVGEELSSNIGSHVRKTLSIPLITWEQASAWPMAVIQQHRKINVETLYSDRAYALEVQDEDWKWFARGTVLIIDPNVTPDHRDLVIVQKTGQKLPTVRQVLIDEEKWYFRPITQDYELIQSTPDHVVLGVIMEYRNQIKICKPNNVIKLQKKESVS